MTSTSSPFYQSIRESFLLSNHTSPNGKRAPVSSLNHRLESIIEHNKNVQRQRRVAAQNTSSHHTDSGNMRGVGDSTGNAQGGLDEEDVLTQEEMDTLRVAEIDAPVQVYVELPNMVDPRFVAPGTVPTGQSPLSLIGEDACVKIYPQHVVLSKKTGSPLVEFVIQELVGINEDEARHALTFELKKADGTAMVIEIVCTNIPARSAIYKLVCKKRSALEMAM